MLFRFAGMKLILIFILSVLKLGLSLHNYVDIEDIQSGSYSVHISSEPVLLRQEYDKFTVLMKSKFGQQYECNLPELAPMQFSVQQKSELEKREISELLQPMKSRPCLTKVRGWWTYKFCFGKYIEQYHTEDGKDTVGHVISLGLFESDFDWDNSTEESPNRRLRYHSQIYSNGTTCDVNGQLRQTEVRFICNEQNTHYFAKIDEPSSCQYIAEIHTDMICKHPYTMLAFKKKPNEISCNPVLSIMEYESYQQQEIEKKKTADEKKIEWLAQGKDKLSKLKELEEKVSSALESNPQKDDGDTAKEVEKNDNGDFQKSVVSDLKNEKQTIKEFLVAQLEKIKQQDIINTEKNEEGHSNENEVSEREKKYSTDDSLIKSPANSDVTLETDNDISVSSKNNNLNEDLQSDDLIAEKKSESTSVSLESENESSSKDNLENSANNENIELKNSHKDKVDRSQRNFGQKVKIKIIRVKDDSEIEEWSDQTSVNVANSGHKTIIAYVQGDGVTDSLNEMIKQQEIERNYRFAYNKKKKKE